MSIHKIAAVAALAQVAAYAPKPIESSDETTPKRDVRSDPIPNRLSADKDSPFYNAEVASQLDIIFEGARRKGDVREYCIEDPETGRGWIRVEARLANGKPRIERGRFVTVLKRGIVKPVWR